MVSTARSVLGVVPGLQATALLGENIKAIDFGLHPKKGRKKKNHTKKIIKTGMTNLVAIPLIGATAQQVNLIS